MNTTRLAHVALGLSLVSLFAAACAAPTDATDDATSSTGTTGRASPAASLDDAAPPLPAELRERALAHVAAAFHDGVAPEWEHATLGEARAIRRPDVDGIAYYEVAVRSGDAPAGYVVLSTGAHDFPIVQWNSRGERPTERVRLRAIESGAAPARYYRFDLGYAAETAAGELAAADENMPLAAANGRRLAAQWRDAKASFATNAREYLTALRSQAADAWTAPKQGRKHAFGTAFGSNGASACQVNDWFATPKYEQLGSYEPPSGRYWDSGCAATAWAILIGWADIQADEGDPKWSRYAGLYRQEGSTDSTGAYDWRAPTSFDWGVRVMTDRISSTLGTTPAGSEGATGPVLMSHITDYLYADGMNGSLIATTMDYGGGNFDSIRDRAQYHICNDQTPAVMGIGNLSHYAVGTFYYLLANGSHSFFLNMGHGGGDDGWYSGGVFFAGTLTPRLGVPVAVPVTAPGMEVTLATYGGNCGAQEGNASAAVAAYCNDESSCAYAIDWHKLGDPAVGCAKTFDVQWRCSKTDVVHEAFVSQEASGKTVNLTCAKIHVESATYGANCGAPAGNQTSFAARACEGKTQCAPTIDYHVLGDPAPGCAKTFNLTYDCGDGRARTVTAPAEAGFGSVVHATCP